jgi:hypothetical protein
MKKPLMAQAGERWEFAFKAPTVLQWQWIANDSMSKDLPMPRDPAPTPGDRGGRDVR